MRTPLESVVGMSYWVVVRIRVPGADMLGDGAGAGTVEGPRRLDFWGVFYPFHLLDISVGDRSIEF